MALNLGDPVNVDGEPIATDADVEELKEKLEAAKRRGRIHLLLGVAFSVVTFGLGLVI